MKKFTKIAAGALAAALALSLGGFMACNSVTDYTFEAEDAVLADGLQLQTGTEWTGTNEEGAEVTVVSYFSNEGQTITWTITSSAQCTAEISIRGSSCQFGFVDGNGKTAGMEVMGALWGQGEAPEGFDLNTAKSRIASIKADGCGVVLKVNDTEATLAGELPETIIDGNAAATAMAMFSLIHCGELTSEINLKKGENTIVLEIESGSGFNVDKIMIKAAAKLTFTKADNSELLPDEE